MSMKSKLLLVTVVSALAMVLSGCAIGGALNYTDNPVGSKVGKACAKNTLGLFATGDASIAAAAKNGGITQVATVDVVSEPGLFVGQFCTIVTGE
jgi:hypothetical protein